MTGRRPRAGVVAAGALLVVTGCGAVDPTAVPLPGFPGALTIVAHDIVFEPAAVSVGPGAPFEITLDNRDSDVPHNVEVLPLGVGPAVATGEIVTGPGVTTLDVPALPPGRFRIICSVHPDMVTELTVGG